MTHDTSYETALAIIGMSGRFPGARDVEAFWRNIVEGVRSIRFFSEEELQATGVDPELLQRPNYVRAGTVVDEIDRFDAAFFGLTPREAEVMDPQHRLFLECAWEALENAAYDPRSYRGSVGVFAGSAFSTYLLNHLYPNTELLELLGQLQIDVGNDRDSLASMVSYKLNLRGPAIAVQTFCSTSLVATHLACQSLINYECDIALAGGVAIILPQENGYLYEEGGILSPDGYCRTFDAQGQGSVMGNGLGIVALKRFQEAVEDGDHIYAVVRGSAVNNDGSQRISYTAPGLDGQANVITGALSYAGVDAETINYFEAHGTATRLGDAVELAAMIKAFASKTRKKQFCAIGSVKPNVGHLDRAAGVTGLMKTALAMHHKQLPPSLNFERSHPDLDLENSPFYVNTHLREWTPNAPGVPRRAGVSSFGLGGTNAHVVIEEAPEREPAAPSRPWQLLLLSTHSATALEAATANLATHIRTHEDISLPDMAHTLQVGRAAFNHRCMVVCRDPGEALGALESGAGITEAANQSHRDRPVAFLFPDEGAQYAGMAQELYQHEKTFRDMLDRCSAFLKSRAGIDLHPMLHAPISTQSSAYSTLKQSFVFSVEYALAQQLISWGIRPAALLGQGVGEYVAACLAGGLSLEDALTLVVCRAQLLQKGATLAMATSEVEARHLTFNAPRIPCISNVTGTWITDKQATDTSYWAQHICQPTPFVDGASTLLQHADYVLLEVGPGHVPVSLAKQPDGSEQADNIIATLPASEGSYEEATLLTALGRLWLAGTTIDWSGFYAYERRYRIVLPTYPFERQRYWIDPPQKQVRSRRQDEPSKGKRPDIADWFYLPTWQHVALPAASAVHIATQSPWLIFEDDLGFGQEMAQRLLTGGHTVIRVQSAEAFAQQAEDCYTLRPGEPADYSALFGALAATGRRPGTILHCWSITRDGETAQTGAERFRFLQERGFYSLLALSRALDVHPGKDTTRVLVVSNGMQAASGQELKQPEKATLMGVCKVLSQENMHILCRNIDIDDGPDVEQLLAEITSSATDPVVMYHKGKRWVQTYTAQRLAAVPAESQTKRLRHRGVYLITGGLGAVGALLAGYLARTVQARIILVGRSALPERGEWERWLQDHDADDRVSRAIRQLREIEAQGGEVLALSASVADETQMQAVIDTIYARFGELHGVIHAAGISDEKAFGLAQQLERETCEEHFQPKVYGTYILEKVLKDRRLDFCILFSSLSAVLGGLGFAAYAAANLFIDAFVQRHNQTADTPWVSINWDTWQTWHLTQGALGRTVAEYAMTPDEGIDVLTRILEQGDLKQVVISTGDLQARIRQWIFLESLQESTEGAYTEKADVLATPARGDYKHRLAEIWQQVLGIEQVGFYDNFFDLGGNSLIALQVVNKIRKVFHVPVPVVALFEAPTVSAMAAYLQPADPVEPEQRQLLSQRRQQARQGVRQQDIAIISMASRFPGASTVEQFWHNLRQGVESVTFFSDEELLAAGVDPVLIHDPSYVRARPILRDVEHFDAAFFGYSPREAELMDPQHRLFLECSWEALERSGYDPQTYEGLVGVFGGANVSTYLHALIREQEQVEAKLGQIDGYQIAIGTDRDSLATSVSYKLNLRGPSFAVQTFCSTSLVAVHLACQSLRAGECDLALAGGVSVRVPVVGGHLYQQGGMESPDGHVRTFDAQAHGCLFGDGAGVVVLKRLSEALADGDQIEAIIKGSALNNDGSLKVSYTAPSVAGQAEVVQAALEQAGVEAESISYVEAHGTATELGDPIEIAALTRAYRCQTERQQYCAIGSVKTNVGHLDRAAGVSGLIKTVLALKHEELPASLHYESPNPEIDFEHSPFYVNAQLTAWKPERGVRRAGINSLGMGGTNVHVIVEEAPQVPVSGPSRPWQLLLLSARTETALQAMRQNLRRALVENDACDLADVAYTLQVGRARWEHRQMLLCRDRQEAIALLEAAEPGQSTQQSQRHRPVAFLFPGVGTLGVEMLQDLYAREETFRQTVERCLHFLRTTLGLDLSDVLSVPASSAGASQPALNLSILRGVIQEKPASHERFTQTALAQPLVFVLEYALARQLIAWGIRPAALLGYSLGEYVAACLAGVFSLEDALTLVVRRARLIADVAPGKMVAVMLCEAEIQPYLSEQVSLAAITAPATCVLAGPEEAIAQLQRQLSAQGIAHRGVETTHAFHSTMLSGLQAPLTELVRGVRLQPPTIPYLSNVTGTWITAEQATDPAYWAQHMCQTVRFANAIGTLLAEPDYLLIEAGPGSSLYSFVKQHPACGSERMRDVLSISPAIDDRQSSQAHLLTALGKLWLLGASVDWNAFYAGERRHRVLLPTYPFERQRYWLPASIHPHPRVAAPAAAPIAREADISDWFYQPVWETAPIATTKPSVLLQRPLLIFEDGCGVSEKVIQQLEQRGHTVVCVRQGEQFARQDNLHFSIRAGNAADYVALYGELKATGLLPGTILHGWSLGQEHVPETGPEYFRSQQEGGFYSLLFLTQAIAVQVEDTPVQVLVVSNAVQSIHGQEVLSPEKASILGACRVISQEHPHILCRSIDLELGELASNADAFIEAIIAECTLAVFDPIVGYRNGQRWIETYRQQPLEATTLPPFRQHGVYLLTGALGGVGLVLAEHLAKTVQAKLILIGRTDLPERSAWASWLEQHATDDHMSEIIRRIQAIEAYGAEALVLTADVADEVRMQAIIQEAMATFGTIHGVFHLAGITSGRAFQPIADMSRVECELHFHAKVYGTFALEKAIAGLKLDFCWLFSSLSSVLGGLGFVGYAAGNIFLDALARRHQQTEGTPWISVNWDTWQVKADMHGVLGASIAAFAMQPEEALEALTRILACGIPRLVNSTGDLHVRLLQWGRLEALRASDGVELDQQIVATRASSVAVPVHGDYEQEITRIWQQVLGVEQVGLYDNFFDLGGNSLIGLQLIARLKKAFQVQIPAVILFEAPTISAQVKYLQPAAEPTIQAQERQQQTLAKRRQMARKVDAQGVALIGMSGRFPGATTIEQFWHNLRNGVESISFFTDEELQAAGIELQELQAANYIKARPVLEGTENFDASFFGYSPREAEVTDPQHRLFLECAWEALEDAAYDTQTYEGLVGIFGGTNISTYMLSLLNDPEMLGSVNSYQLLAGNDKDSLTSSVSYKLNLRGPSFAVQTFCSTSLVATHLACQSLLNGECDIALAGGASIRVPSKGGYLYEEGGMESPDGHVRTFDAQAGGSMFGDGVGVVVLKRLSEALEDGDHIYAVVKGSAINNDGSLKVSYAAPSVAGQAEVVQTALAQAGVEAESISYVEAHGTATRLGDPIEIASLTKAFRTHTAKAGYCAIGSVKTNVGHLDRAAGISGLIKTALALWHEEIPPSLHYQRPNPEIDFEHSPFYVNTQLSPWKRNGKPRRAGINSLGMGGTNAHVVLEEAPEPAGSGPSRPWQLLLLSARTESALDNVTARLREHLQQHEDEPLADVAYTLQMGRRGFEHRRMLLCRDRTEAIAALEKGLTTSDWREGASFETRIDRPVAFLFPGLGEQFVGMAQELYQQEATFRSVVDHCQAFLNARFGLDVLSVLYPKADIASSSVNGPMCDQRACAGETLNLRALLGHAGQPGSPEHEQIKQTALAQPVVFMIEYALAQLFMQWGVRPAAMLGYSLGEYVAACLAGVLSLDDALLLVARRARLIEQLPRGAMLAVTLSEADAQPYIDEQINLAIMNGPAMCVLAGPVAAIEQLEARLQAEEIACRRVETTHAFHSHMLEVAREELTSLVSTITLKAPRIPYISNITGTWITAEQATDPAYWAQHMCQTVRFSDGVSQLLEKTEHLLLEVGVGQSLCSFVKMHPACERERMPLVLNTLPMPYEQRSDAAYVFAVLGKLWLRGVSIDWRGVYAAEKRQRLSLPTYPFERQRYWLEAGKRGRAPQQVNAELERIPNMADWFSVPAWKQTFRGDVQAGNALQEARCWLIFLDTQGIGRRISDNLLQRGQQVVTVTAGISFSAQGNGAYTIQPDRKSDYESLLKDLRSQGEMPTRVIHLWSVTPRREGCGVLEDALDAGFYSLLALAQALGDLEIETCDITVVSNGVQDVTGDEWLCPEKATIIGPCRVIPQEYVTLRCRHIDLALAEPGSYNEEALLELLLEEIVSEPVDALVALRGRHRWTQTFEPLRLEQQARPVPRLRAGGVYLITGGLGGIGLAMAEHLARTVQAKLVLTSRSGLPARQEWPTILASQGDTQGVGRQIRVVQELEAAGTEVLILSADVASEQQMRAVIEQALATFGTIHGVLHTAGLPGVGLMQLKTPEMATRVLAPKVMGTLVLERVLEGLSLDFLALFSSTTSSTGGGPGQVDYCAANAFLDAYARRHRARHGITIAIDWSEWQWNAWESGLTGYGAEAETFFKQSRQRFGITFEEGAEAFRRILAGRLPQVVVSTQDFRIVIEQSKYFTAALVLQRTRESRQSRELYARPDLGSSYMAPRSDLERKIASVWEEILGVAPVGIDDNFFDLGGNSLTGIDLMTRLRKLLQKETLGSYVLYEAPSVSAMAQHMEQEQKKADVAVDRRYERGERRRESLKNLLSETRRTR